MADPDKYSSARPQPVDKRESIQIGDSLWLYSLERISTILGISREATRLTCKALRVPPIIIGNARFYSLHALEKALYIMAQPGSPGFAFPGSYYKMSNRHNEVEDGPAIEFPEEFKEKLDDPRIEKQMEKDATINYKHLKAIMNRLATIYGKDGSISLINDLRETRRHKRKSKENN